MTGRVVRWSLRAASPRPGLRRGGQCAGAGWRRPFERGREREPGSGSHRGHGGPGTRSAARAPDRVRGGTDSPRLGAQLGLGAASDRCAAPLKAGNKARRSAGCGSGGHCLHREPEAERGTEGSLTPKGQGCVRQVLITEGLLTTKGQRCVPRGSSPPGGAGQRQQVLTIHRGQLFTSKGQHW